MNFTPYAGAIRAGLIAAAAGCLLAAGWLANGWRLGKDIAQLETAVARKEVAHQTALTERQQKAMQWALEAMQATQARLSQERKANARLRAEAAKKAPTAPQFACRELPLPEEYLEVFRQ